MYVNCVAPRTYFDILRSTFTDILSSAVTSRTSQSHISSRTSCTKTGKTLTWKWCFYTGTLPPSHFSCYHYSCYFLCYNNFNFKKSCYDELWAFHCSFIKLSYSRTIKIIAISKLKIPSYETVHIKQLKTAFLPRNYKVYLTYSLLIM